MTKFLVTYHGGSMPESAEGREQAMQAFGAWAGRVGDALLDPGAPLGPSVTVSRDEVRPGPATGAVAGYSVLEAADVNAAAALVKDHPFVGRGGSLQVTETLTP